MIVGVGIDLVSISRLANKMQNPAFVEKIFSAQEIAYCESSHKKEHHFAGRFAVKEAFLKAIGEGLNAGFDLKDIEVKKDEKEKPTILLHGEFGKIRLQKGWQTIHVSLSHEEDYATAIVIIEK